jgi:hypothetical protein
MTGLTASRASGPATIALRVGPDFRQVLVGAPKLGQAGTHDCPTCDGTGLDLSAVDKFEEADAE